jgi:hypothetical protein
MKDVFLSNKVGAGGDRRGEERAGDYQATSVGFQAPCLAKISLGFR